MNPLDREGDRLEVELMNPNPTSSKTKDGPKYRVSFEVKRELWDLFMDANTSGLVLDGVLVTVELGASGAPEQPEKPKGGVYSKEAAFFCEDDLVNQFARTCGYGDMKDMIYQRCQISSRAELDHNEAALARFRTIKHSFAQAML